MSESTSSTAAGSPAEAGAVARAARAIGDNVERVVAGKRGHIELALTVLFARGHLLIEDVPGVGKTALARAIAASIDGQVSRIQFTPDLLPGDVTGSSIYNQSLASFEFQHGPVFANLVIADEINRASPKTQSALLEAMGERQVSVDGTTYELEAPFMVVATQNPIDNEGTYALPEAQRDRFMARMSMGYPSAEAELSMLEQRDGHDPIAELRPVIGHADTVALIRAVEGVHLSREVKRYLVALTQATRDAEGITVGASPRATLHLAAAARARAAIAGRAYVVPQDITDLAPSVLAHRLGVTREHDSTRARHRLVRGIVHGVPVPRRHD